MTFLWRKFPAHCICLSHLAGRNPTAGDVLIVNVSLGNRRKVFDQRMSAWARLIDRLSYLYGLLFVVSAGKRSLWVGDQKQAIFGFRQTDPALVNAVIEKIRPTTGGIEESLDTSRRSRPDLVKFSNAVFGAAFPPKGIPEDKVIIPNIHRTEPANFGLALRHTDRNHIVERLCFPNSRAGFSCLRTSERVCHAPDNEWN